LGLILDTSILVAHERKGNAIEDILDYVWTEHGEDEIAISTVTAVELTHGIYRSRNERDRERRQSFTEDAFHDLLVYPVTLDVARLAGQIEGEQAAQGIAIPFEDLVIGATALHLGYDVATLNVKHFQLIPKLKIVIL